MHPKGTPAFMSFQTLIGRGHVHCLRDDLESFLYVVLYAALRWLPVELSETLDWWIADFFSAPRAYGHGGGAGLKGSNAAFRWYTSGLRSTTSFHVVNWLNAATDLHYKDGAPNPLWDDGKALREMWEKVLAEDLPSNNRVVNQIPGMKTRDDGSLHATHTSATSTQGLYRSRNEPTRPPAATPAKRPHSYSAENSVFPPALKPSKRSRRGLEPQMRSMSVGNYRWEDLMTGVDSPTTSLGDTSPLPSEGSAPLSPLDANTPTGSIL